MTVTVNMSSEKYFLIANHQMRLRIQYIQMHNIETVTVITETAITQLTK
jgi:hypothetical protein